MNERNMDSKDDMAALHDELERLHIELIADDPTFSSASEPAYSTEFDLETGSEFTSPDFSETSSASPPGAMLQFLVTAFPHLSQHMLDTKLQQPGADMQSVVEIILSEEYIRELEERGLDGLNDSEGLVPQPPRASWTDVTPRKKKVKSKTILLGDVRQRVAPSTPPAIKISTKPTAAIRSTMDDSPWVRLDSLASRLAHLLPPTTPATFLSPFHDPKYTSPAAALRATLSSLAAKQPAQIPPDTLRFLLETYPAEALGDDEDAAIEDVDLRDDARLCLRAAEARIGDAMDVLTVLRDLARAPEYGTIHSPAPARHYASFTGGTLSSNPGRPVASRASTAPPDITTFAAAATAARASQDHGWQTVAKKKKPPPAQPAHADFIPAYRVDAASRANGFGSQHVSAHSASDIDFHRREARALHAERNEALRHALRYWKGGNTRNLGGEVATYYAERARALFDAARSHSLDAARMSVSATHRSTASHDEIDLHGLTIAEATVVVQEILKSKPPTPARPLRIITGRGRHSHEYKTVLQPALRTRLTDEGWLVTLWDAGLTIRGRSTATP